MSQDDNDTTKVTVLACFETLLATAIIAVLVTLTKNSFLLFAPALYAPLLLLKTPSSVSFAARLFERCESIFQPEFFRSILPKMSMTATGVVIFLVFLSSCVTNETDDFEVLKAGIIAYFAASTVLAVSWVLILAVICIGIRVIATIQAFLSSPQESLLAIPRNWRDTCFCVDLLQAPELFPGASSDVVLGSKYSLRSYFGSLNDGFTAFLRKVNEADGRPATSSNSVSFIAFMFPVWLSMSVCSLVAGALLFIAAILHRFSLKATCLLYLPLFYLADTALTIREPARFLVAVRRSKFATRMAIFVIASHLILPLLVAFLVNASLVEIRRDTLAFALLNYFSFSDLWLTTDCPSGSQCWSSNTVTKLTNAALVFVCLALAAWGLTRAIKGDHPSVRISTATLRILIVIRALLTIYSIIYVIVLISYYVDSEQLAAGWRGIVEYVQAIRVDWSFMPKQPDS